MTAMLTEIELEFTSNVDVSPINTNAQDSSVVWAAKVSTQGEDSLEEVDGDAEASKGLINFLMKNRHGTPFEHNSFTFFVSAPIFVFREFHRHRIGFSYNEESGRYTQLKPKFYVPGRDRNLVQVGKPGHYEFVPGTEEQWTEVHDALCEVAELAYAKYEHLIGKGIAKEVARMCLPVNIFSSMYVTCNARSLMAFLSLRTKSDLSVYKSFPQREIEMVAEKMELEFSRAMPLTYAAFNTHGRVCP